MATDKVADQAFLPNDSRVAVPARRAVQSFPAQPTAARRAVRIPTFQVIPINVAVNGATPIKVLGQDSRRVSIIFVASNAGPYSVGPFATNVVNIGWKLRQVGAVDMGQVVFTESTHGLIVGWEWWGASGGPTAVVGWEVIRR